MLKGDWIEEYLYKWQHGRKSQLIYSCDKKYTENSDNIWFLMPPCFNLVKESLQGNIMFVAHPKFFWREEKKVMI